MSASENNIELIPIIVCGGKGTRLWPLSCKQYPKPFINLPDGSNLFSKAIDRSLFLTKSEIIVVSNAAFAPLIENELAKLKPINRKQISIIYEPVSRNTAPAIFAACHYVTKKYQQPKNVLILTADHEIETKQQFISDIKLAFAQADGQLNFLFGIKPDHASPNFGYAEIEENKDSKIVAIKKFIEKPNQKNAELYFQQKSKYYWNSGMFLFRCDILYEAFQKYCPDIIAATVKSFPAEITASILLKQDFSANPNISIDHAIMEKMSGIRLIISSFSWSDLGSLANYYKLAKQDEDQNFIATNNFLNQGSHNIILDAPLINKDIIMIDMEGTTVIDTPQALIICKTEKLAEITKFHKDDIGK